MNKVTLLKDAAFYSIERVKGSDISSVNYVTTESLLQNKEGAKESNLQPSGTLVSFELGDILIGNIRPYLKKIWFADKSGGASPDVLVFRAKEGIVSRFLYYALLRDDFFIHMMKGAKGTKMPRGDKQQILQFEVPLLDINEQKKIASVLSTLDAKIELNNRINAELEAMAKLIYDYWFVQFDFPDQDGKPYKSSGGKMVWNDNLKREIPKGWSVKILKEIATTGSGGTPLSSQKAYYEEGTIPWINSGEVNASFVVSAKNYITELGLKNSSAKLYPPGTILVAMYGATAGQVSLMNIEACTNQAVCAIMPIDYRLTPFLKFGLHQMYSYLVNLSSGSARDNLSQEKLRCLTFPIPDDKSLERYYKIANICFDKIICNLKENQHLSSLRDWLLPMLMNGQVKVS